MYERDLIKLERQRELFKKISMKYRKSSKNILKIKFQPIGKSRRKEYISKWRGPTKTKVERCI